MIILKDLKAYLNTNSNISSSSKNILGFQIIFYKNYIEIKIEIKYSNNIIIIAIKIIIQYK